MPAGAAVGAGGGRGAWLCGRRAAGSTRGRRGSADTTPPLSLCGAGRREGPRAALVATTLAALPLCIRTGPAARSGDMDTHASDRTGRAWRPRTPPPGGRVAAEPGPGQESVWDYPRPPVVVPTAEHVLVMLGTSVVARTRRAVRVLETSHPPTYYLPLADVADGALVPVEGVTTVCEFKGRAVYFDVVGAGRDGRRIVRERAAWAYPDPAPGFELLAHGVAVHPALLTCSVEGEPVVAQDGGFYGGWVTSRVVGPFKGGAGTLGW